MTEKIKEIYPDLFGTLFDSVEEMAFVLHDDHTPEEEAIKRSYAIVLAIAKGTRNYQPFSGYKTKPTNLMINNRLVTDAEWFTMCNNKKISDTVIKVENHYKKILKEQCLTQK